MSDAVLVRYRVFMTEMVPLYWQFVFFKFKLHIEHKQVFVSRNPTLLPSGGPLKSQPKLVALETQDNKRKSEQKINEQAKQQYD